MSFLDYLTEYFRGPQGPAGPAGPAGPPGPGLEGYEVVYAEYTVAAGSASQNPVSAPTGKVVLGGGVGIPNSDVTVFLTRPTSDGTAWEGGVKNNGSIETTYHVWAVCINDPR